MLPVTRLAVDTVAVTQVIGDYSYCCGRGMTDQLFVCPGAKPCYLLYWEGSAGQVLGWLIESRLDWFVVASFPQTDELTSARLNRG